MFDKKEMEKMFEIGYKVEIMAGDSPLKDVFQPMITLKIGRFYQEFYILDEFIETFENLIRGLQVGNIEEMIFFLYPKEQLKRFSIVEEVEEYERERFYLKNYPVIYDEEGNIVNSHVRENLEKKMQKLVNKIYKNVIPLFAKDFSVKVDGEYTVVLFLYYDSIGVHKEIEIKVPYSKVLDFGIDFFDILKTLIQLFKLKDLPEDLKNFINFIESKIK